MRIKRLRLSGFKSFVEPAELRIEPGLTGVVGPNGCGKSNLLEALRWTMGEGSPKSLRGAGMEDVIFAGTATRPPRNIAEVSITGDRSGPDGAAGDEVEVVRRIERGAGSTYRIDGRDVRARDVALLFADAATGAHSPAMVGQGRIGAVIAAKPAERRQMLEEAAGIAGLHVRRRDAEAKLRATEANLDRARTLLADADARAAALRRQARTAERYRDLSGRIVAAEARLLFARWREAKAAADAARVEAEAAGVAVAAATAAERAAAHAQAEAIERALDARVAATTAREAAAAADHRVLAARSDHAAAVRRLNELRRAHAQGDADRAREDGVAADAAAALVRLEAEAGALTDAIAAAERAMPQLDAALLAADRDGQAAEVALAGAIGAHAAGAAEARVADAALAAARARRDRAAREGDDLARQAAALADPAPLAADRAAADDARARARAAMDAARLALADADGGEAAAVTARDAAANDRGAARAALAAIEAEAAALARAAAAAPAISDRTIDRVRVAPGYERAVAAALGDDLDAPAAAWAGADPWLTDPPPPGDAAPLGRHVDAPPALARRLAQLFVVDRDDGRPLAAGQRLVTRGGALRRWDGFGGTGGGAAAAARLERRNRLAALDAARPAASAALDAATAASAGCERALAALRAAAVAARASLARAEADEREAIRAADHAAARLERLDGQRADLAARAARAVADAGEAVAAHRDAAAAVAALPDRRAADAALAGHRAAADRARAAIGAARAARSDADRHLAAARERRAALLADVRGQRARADDAAARLAAMAAAEAALAAAIDLAAPQPAALAAEVEARIRARDAARTAVAAREAAERTATADQTGAAAAHARAGTALGDAREARAGAAARAETAEARRAELGRTAGDRFGCPAPVLPERHGFAGAAVLLPADEQAAHDRLLAERERIGPVNLVAAQELAELDAATARARADGADLTEAVARLHGSIALLNREGRARLHAAFEAVDTHFRALFAALFDAGKGDGGSAHLALIDADDPLEAGLEIMAQPPGKRLQSLTLLSGGEQALTAVALIFALFLTNPAPICVLDEVDAPLDDANIERFCALLERMAADTDTSYLIVTHNAVTMSRMHRLFGVTMVERGVSRLVSVDLRAAETMAAE